jgi:hypothetical protein
VLGLQTAQIETSIRQYWEELEERPRAKEQPPRRAEVDGHRQRLDRIGSSRVERDQRWRSVSWRTASNIARPAQTG